ncbi:MAG: DNA ligase [Myxococcota bacterium]
MDLADGESIEVQGSGSKPYLVKNDGGIYSCSCPAWRHQSLPIDVRTCKHLKRIRGEEAEIARVGVDATRSPIRPSGGRASAVPKEGVVAPGVLLAERWDPGAHDPRGWWVSEKLDGVRAYWDGTQFLSRNGNRFVAPDWFTEGLPDHPLDGELWGGRKRFQETVSVVRSVSAGERWRELSFLVFDSPAHGGTFEERIASLETLLGGGGAPYAKALDHDTVRDIEHLREELARVEALGGEGVMLRQPGSRYVPGRSSTLLKVKSFFDAEGVVIDHVAGAGRHRGRLGSLLVEAADGTRFNVGTGFSDREREAPPEIGAVVTYRYQELTKAGVPRFPSYVGVRVDATGPTPIVRPRSAPPAPAPRPPASTPPVEASMGSERMFEFVSGSSSKFWAVSVDGTSYTARWGRIGSGGQSKTKEAASAAKAQAEVDKLVAEKVGKGYVEVEGGEAPAPAPKAAAPAKAAPAKAAPAKAARARPAPARPAPEAAPAAAAAPAPAPKAAAKPARAEGPPREGAPPADDAVSAFVNEKVYREPILGWLATLIGTVTLIGMIFFVVVIFLWIISR